MAGLTSRPLKSIVNSVSSTWLGLGLGLGYGFGFGLGEEREEHRQHHGHPNPNHLTRVRSTASIMATPLERQTIPSAELIVAATMLTRQSPATNIPAAAGPGQREEGSDQSGASWRRPLIG